MRISDVSSDVCSSDLHHGIRVRGLLYGDIYPDQHDYSQATAIGRVGYRYQFARDTVALSPSFEVGSLGSSILYDAPGINAEWTHILSPRRTLRLEGTYRDFRYRSVAYARQVGPQAEIRSEEHTSELQSLMRTSY